MDSVVVALIALLAAHIGNVAASCREVPNDDMLEYLCEGGHPGDLAVLPDTTEKLRISRMPLRRITADTFAKFGDSLWVLSCSHCEISDIEANAFRRLINLQQLSLDNNQLTVVRASWFEGLDSLTYLNINYNDISEIEDGVYQNLPALVDFRISGNRLRCLNLDAMSHLRQLKRMFLGENPEFGCPHAVSEFLENQRVTFARDPEWRRLAQDAVKVQVPPAHVEEEEVPAFREKLYPDMRPPEAPVVPPLSGDRSFNYAEHYGRRKRPTTTTSTTTMRPIWLHEPRVVPIPPFGVERTSHQESSSGQTRPAVFYPYATSRTPWASLQEPRSPLEDARMTAGADRPPLMEEDVLIHPSRGSTVHETTSFYPTYVTSERSRAPSEELRPSSEDIRPTAGADRSPSTEHVSTLPVYIQTHQTKYPLYATPEGPQVPLMKSRIPSDDITEPTARPMLTEHTLTYPPYEPTRETMPYPYATSWVPVSSDTSSGHEMTTWSDGSRDSQDTVLHPLHTATSDGWKMSNGSVQVTRPWSTSGPDAFVTDSHTRWAGDSMEHRPGDWSQDGERREQWPTDRQEMPYHASREPTDHTPDGEAVIDDRLLSSTDDFIATDLVEREPEPSWTMSPDDDGEDLHYIRPVSNVHPIATDGYYQAYNESTVYPSSLNYRDYDGNDDDDGDDETTAVMETTTDKPLPKCAKENSAPRTRPASVLVMSIVVIIFGHLIITEF